MSLRTRLILGVLVLAGLALLTADVATYTSLRSFLVQRVDSSLQTDHFTVERAVAEQYGGSPCDGLRGTISQAYVELRTETGEIACSEAAVDFSKLRPPLGGSRGAAPGSPQGQPRQGGPAPLPRRPPPRLLESLGLDEPAGFGVERPRYFDAPAVRGGGAYRVRAAHEPEMGYQLIIARPLDDVQSTLHRLLLIELLVTAAVLAAIALLGLWLVRLGLRPLDRIGATAAAIAAGDLSRRVERAEQRTEVGRLGLALNAMLGQIERAFNARAASERKLRRFVADASHELRTPLTAIRAYAELFERGADRRPEDLARAMTGIERESERMSVLVDDLLLLARLDEGRPLAREQVALDRVVSEAVETARTVDPARAIDLAAEQAVVLGDHDRLRQIVDNLLANVRAHTPPSTAVRVDLSRVNGNAVIEVADAGPGMTAEEAEHVFERFYRADASRARSSGGVGLGLSIVAAVAEAHGGAASAEGRPGAGATFRITLPLDGQGTAGSSN